jgi:GT2 family glycosyltransferase
MSTKLDVCLVLFHARWDELEDTLQRIAGCQGEFRRLQVLLSGTSGESERLHALLSTTRLADKAEVIHRYDNLGFASGHNLLLMRAFTGGADACLVLNPDVEIEAGALTRLIECSNGLLDNSLIGPSLSSHTGAERIIDSLGIRWTASGRHLDDRQGCAWSIDSGAIVRCQGVTGACLLVGGGVYRKLVERTGHFFDDFFLAYREDAELGVRASAVGIGSVVIEMDGFSHRRHVQGFDRGNALADLLGVRNRFLLRWKLGRLRPGAPILPSVRDAIVIVAVLVRERTSLPGLREAFRIRRSVRRSFGLRS